MENNYLIEVHGLSALLNPTKIATQKFIVSFDGYYAHFGATPNRRITTCNIIEYPSKKIYSGAAIKNPNDIGYDDFIGKRLAFKRAVLTTYMIWNELGRTSIPFNVFWQLFRQALARNEIYLSERKNHG